MLLTVLLAVLPLVGVLLLAVRGFLDGDVPDDAVVSVALVPRQGPDAVAWCAEIEATSRSSRPVLVLARARPATSIGAGWAFDQRVTVLRHRRDLAGVELLGAVEAGATQVWLLPLRPSNARAFRVVVMVEQRRTRTRGLTFTRVVAAAARAQASSALGVWAADPKERR